MAVRKKDRIFNRTGDRHYRRSYSLTEFRIGVLILTGLVGITGWVVWRGANPDPELFSMEESLLDKGSDWAPIDDKRVVSEMPQASAVQPDDRGPVPTGLAGEGWTEKPVAQFDASNLYEKINGREGYYKSFGFQRLYYISLLGEQDETAAIDIEMYDMGKVANALGAYAGERQEDAEPELLDGAISHISRNALFLVKGRFYVRAIASNETEMFQKQLTHLRERFSEGLSGEPLPWAYALFVGQLGLDPGKIGYLPENAFSFGFASNVYTIDLPDESQLFVVACEDDARAGELAQQFTDGFTGIGAAAGTEGGVAWSENSFLNTFTGVTAVGSVVIGARDATTIAAGAAELDKMRKAVAALPQSLLAQAASEGAAGAGGDNDGEGAGEGAGDGDDYGEDSGNSEGGEGGYGEGVDEPSYGDEPAGEPSYGDEPAGENLGEPSYE